MMELHKTLCLVVDFTSNIQSKMHLFINNLSYVNQSTTVAYISANAIIAIPATQSITFRLFYSRLQIFCTD